MGNKKPEDLIKKKCLARLETWMTKWCNSESRGVVIDYDDVSAQGKHFDIYSGRWVMNVKQTQKGKRDIIAFFGVGKTLWVYLIECKSEFGIQRPEQITYEKKFKEFTNVVYELVYDPVQIDRTLDRLTGRTAKLLAGVDEFMFPTKKKGIFLKVRRK
jgi:hypothetical protein